MNDVDFLNDYFSRVTAAIESIDSDAPCRFVGTIEEAVLQGGQVMYGGNGGSAATASHFVNDLVMAYARTGRVVRASSLTDNPALVTGISNDHSFDEVFEYQLRALARPGDLVVAISAPGNSRDLVRAIEYANSAGLGTVAIVGFGGGALRKLAQIAIHIPTMVGDYGPAEDAHLVINHAVSGLIMTRRVSANEP